MSKETYYIYAIRHNKTKRLYIGSTKNPKRLQSHLSNLRNGKHHSTELQSDYDKYGEDLTFFLLETLPNDKWGFDARGREAYWIHYYGTDISGRGYNSPEMYRRTPLSEFPIIIPDYKSIKLDYSQVEAIDDTEKPNATQGDTR